MKSGHDAARRLGTVTGPRRPPDDGSATREARRKGRAQGVEARRVRQHPTSASPRHAVSRPGRSPGPGVPRAARVQPPQGEPAQAGHSPSWGSAPRWPPRTSRSWARPPARPPESSPRACPRWRCSRAPPRPRCGPYPAASPPAQLRQGAGRRLSRAGASAPRRPSPARAWPLRAQSTPASRSVTQLTLTPGPARARHSGSRLSRS